MTIIFLSGCSITIGDPPKSKKENKSSETNQNQNKKTASAPKIDILSQDFSTHYMNENHVRGYKGLMKAMDKEKIESKFGSADEVRNFLGREGHVYGNIMVMYYLSDKRPIQQYGIVPNKKETYREFVDVHGEPDQDLRTGYGRSFVVYNKTPNNGYQIVVYTSGNKEDDEITYLMQYPDNFEFTQSSDEHNTVITSDNVYNVAESFEGIDKADKSFMKWKPLKKNGNVFSLTYTDNKRKILGSYKVSEDGYVESFDGNGNKIRASYIHLNE